MSQAQKNAAQNNDGQSRANTSEDNGKHPLAHIIQDPAVRAGVKENTNWQDDTLLAADEAEKAVREFLTIQPSA